MASVSVTESQQATAAGMAEASLAQVQLLRRAQGGDRAAYGHIVTACQDRLYNALLRMVGDPEEASELAQETFVRGLVKLDSFRGESAPYTWLFSIGMNLAVSKLRKDTRRRTFSLDAVPDNSRRDNWNEDQASGLVSRMAGTREAMPQEQLERREEQQQVLDAMGRLEAGDRALIVMRDIEGFEYQQMADVLGLPLGTLKSRLFRARLALREQLAGYMKG